MAASIATPPARRPKPWTPDRLERILAFASAGLLAIVLVAIARGHAEWGRIPAIVWAHVATILIALALTPPMLLRPRGDRWHRRLGRIWAVAMLATALLSFRVTVSHPGHFSLIHLLSLYVVVQVPLIVWSARTHRVEKHRGAVRGMVIGALLIAGFFTFPFGRLMGHWLLG